MSGMPDCAPPARTKDPEYLRKSYSEAGCNTPEARRRQIVKLLDGWIDQIKDDCGLKSTSSDTCSGCLPAFTCLAPFPYKRPFCHKERHDPLITHIPTFEKRFTSDKKNVSDQDDRVEIILVDTRSHDPPVWERPRIRSQKLVGGNFKQLTACFKKNGLAIDDCPRTPSCKLIQSMEEWIEVDKKTQKPQPKIECCCCPGVVSTVPDFECINCKLEAQERSASISPPSSSARNCCKHG